MKAFGQKQPVWDYAHLNDWITAPQKYIDGTKMTFVGIKERQQQINVIAYLHTLGSTLPIPAPKPAAPAPAGPEAKSPASAPPSASGAPVSGSAADTSMAAAARNRPPQSRWQTRMAFSADAPDRLGQGLDRHPHVMGVGVQDAHPVQHDGDVPRPERQIAARQRRRFDRRAHRPLLVAVARTASACRRTAPAAPGQSSRRRPRRGRPIDRARRRSARPRRQSRPGEARPIGASWRSNIQPRPSVRTMPSVWSVTATRAPSGSSAAGRDFRFGSLKAKARTAPTRWLGAAAGAARAARST